MEGRVAAAGIGNQARGERRGAAVFERDGTRDGLGAHGRDEVRPVSVGNVDSVAGHRPFEPLGQADVPAGPVTEVGSHLPPIGRQADACQAAGIPGELPFHQCGCGRSMRDRGRGKGKQGCRRRPRT